MPRVLFVHHRPQASGAARSLALLIGALGDEWEAHVIVPDGAAAELFERSGATVHRGPVPAFTHTWDVQYHGLRWLVALREALWVPGHVRQLRCVLRDVRPDLVHINDVVMLVSGAVAARAGYPVVWHLRSSLPNRGRDRRSRWIARWIDRYAQGVIAIDSDVAATYPLRRPVETIFNPVRLPPRPHHRPQSRRVLTIVLFGYLRRQKGWPQVVDAARLLANRGAPQRFVVVGGSVRSDADFRGARGRLFALAGLTDDEAEMRSAVRESGLDDHFTFLPFTSDPEDAYRLADVVLFPNQGTGLGRPVLEAAAHGSVVVASGSPDGAGILLPGETGLLLPKATPEALADAIELLAADPELRARLGANARRLAEVGFEPAGVASSLESLYARVADLPG